MDDAELEQDRGVDPEALDVECQRHADVTWRWGERATKARTAADVLKAELERAEARVGFRLRLEDPSTRGLKTWTEGALRSAVLLDHEYQDAEGALARARVEANRLGLAVDVLAVKQRMLDALVRLHGMQYFAGPPQPRDFTAAVRAREGRVRGKQATKIRVRGKG